MPARQDSIGKQAQEWFRQAAYDVRAARTMFEGRKYLYTVFLCHLSVEKALKGLYQKRLRKAPPKVHNLVYLVESIAIELPDDLYSFVVMLNRLCIPTRYPDDLAKTLKRFDRTRSGRILRKSRELLTWLRAK